MYVSPIPISRVNITVTKDFSSILIVSVAGEMKVTLHESTDRLLTLFGFGIE